MCKSFFIYMVLCGDCKRNILPGGRDILPSAGLYRQSSICQSRPYIYWGRHNGDFFLGFLGSGVIGVIVLGVGHHSDTI